MRLLLQMFALWSMTLPLIAGHEPPPQVGVASFYADLYHGRTTAYGEKYNKNALTAAHLTLPHNTKVRVTHLGNKKSVIVRINDRGPFDKKRVIDLSRAAAQQLDLVKDGTAKVKIEVISSPNDKPIAKSDTKSTNKTTTTTKPRKEKETQLNIIQEASKMESGGLYKMQVLKLEPKGYGVQIAGYSDYAAVVQQVAVLQKKWFKGAMVFVDDLNGKPYYKIILGPFPNEAQAKSYRDNVKKKYKIKDAFIVNLSKMGQ